MIYRLRKGSRVTGIAAEVVGTALAAIQAEQGRLRPDVVVAAATPVDAPLHPAFEWDDESAGHEYRLIQARQLIRAVVVVRDETPDEPPRQVYVHVGAEEGYQPIEYVVTRPDLYELALTELQRRFNSADSALKELRDAAADTADPDRLAAISLAVQAFATVREALSVLAR
jgi:hypothetical protein